MTNLQTILKLINELSPQERELISQYLQQPLPQDKPEIKKRVLGLHAHLGEAWLSDDFNAELPDAFWGFDEPLA